MEKQFRLYYTLEDGRKFYSLKSNGAIEKYTDLEVKEMIEMCNVFGYSMTENLFITGRTATLQQMGFSSLIKIIAVTAEDWSAELNVNVKIRKR